MNKRTFSGSSAAYNTYASTWWYIDINLLENKRQTEILKVTIKSLEGRLAKAQTEIEQLNSVKGEHESMTKKFNLQKNAVLRGDLLAGRVGAPALLNMTTEECVCSRRGISTRT